MRWNTILAAAILAALLIFGFKNMMSGDLNTDLARQASGASGGGMTVVVDGLKDDGRTIDLALRATLRVNLESNPSTGFQWTAVEPLPSCLEAGPIYFEDARQSVNPNIVGARGRQIFEFKAIRPGSGTLHLEYRRAWEKDKVADKTFRLTVRVQ